MINRTAIADAIALTVRRWRWRRATGLTDLANRQADRLAKSLSKQTDEHSREWVMFSALVALGRAGVVVHDWRPGTFSYVADFGTTMETRACVTGFADDETKDWLDNLLLHASEEPGATEYGLTHIFELYGPGCKEYERYDGGDEGRDRGRAWVERIDGRSTARIGAQMTAEQVYRAFPARDNVQQELRKAWQITICAPTWGNSRMWNDLLRLLHENHRAATA